jgi:hypothetical protein
MSDSNENININNTDDGDNDDHIPFPKMSDSTQSWQLPKHSKLFSSKTNTKKRTNDKSKTMKIIVGDLMTLRKSSPNDWCVMVRRS